MFKSSPAIPVVCNIHSSKSVTFIIHKTPGKGISIVDSGLATNVLSCGIKLVKLSAVHTNERRLFQTVGAP